MEDQLAGQKTRLDKRKGKIGLNTSKHAIPDIDPEVKMAMVREVMEKGEKKEQKEKLEEDTNMEEEKGEEESSE